MKKHYIIAMAAMLCSLSIAAQPRSASAPVKLLSSPTGLMAPVWSPDGSKIAVTTDAYTGILVANADGSDMQIITDAPGAGYKMAWTNDGAEIVGRTNVYEGARVLHEVKSWNVKTGRATMIQGKARTSAAPTLRAAGKSQRNVTLYEQMMADAGNIASKVPALQDFAGRIVMNPAVSPDGSQIAFQVEGRGMWLINADGTNLRGLGMGSHPAWLPDGKALVYTIVKDNGQQFTSSVLYSMDLATGASYALTNQTGIIPLTPAVSPDGKKVAFENAADAAIYVVTLK